jgi:acylphosphatase
VGGVEREARRFLVSGRVQGVGFRDFVRRAAGELGLDGWVRNLADGRVEVHAEGGAAELDALAARLRRGPAFARVSGLAAEGAAPAGHVGFDVRASER